MLSDQVYKFLTCLLTRSVISWSILKNHFLEWLKLSEKIIADLKES